MKLKLNTIIFFILLAFHLLLCAGCASKHLTVLPNYATAGTGLLSDLKPSVVCLSVVDQRPIEQQNNIGVQRNTTFGTKHADITLKTREVQIIHDALKTELEKSGHRVLNSKQDHGGITVIVWLTQFLIDSKAVNSHIELVGSIRAVVIVSDSVGNIPQASFTVEGSYRDFIQMGWLFSGGLFGPGGLFSFSTPKSNIESVLNGTLAEFVRRFCLEPKFRKFFI
jgi:hypothetical protein